MVVAQDVYAIYFDCATQDTNWIESMNSVMDDNKMLTLASNERIPLKAYMRLIFEIRDLNFASPATVCMPAWPRVCMLA